MIEMELDAKKIETMLEEDAPSDREVEDVLKKAVEARGLALSEAGLLLSSDSEGSLGRIQRAAVEVKERIFGKRVVLFAPLYLSSHCANDCLYCGFRSSNKDKERTALSTDEIIREARALVDRGFKRVLLVTGDDPRQGVQYVISAVKAIYENTGMRIVHVNAPPMPADSFRGLKKAGVGVYQSFQETYHRPTYESVHPSGRKKDYAYRLGTMDRAMSAGFGDVGIGPLFGLYDYRFESLSAIAHSNHLRESFGAEAHTISVPRLCPAEGGFAPLSVMSDDELIKAVAVLRLAVPTAGLVISTREGARLRKALMHAGASQFSAASRTNPGGYSAIKEDSLPQFATTDHRTLAEVMASIVEEGFVPSLCTSCYRVGRVGPAFTEKTLSGGMERICAANAILTLKEYIKDSAKNGQRPLFEEAVNRAMDDIQDPAFKKALLEKMEDLEKGKRDVYF